MGRRLALLELCDKPVHALHEPGARECGAAHDLPLALAQVCQSQSFGDLCRRKAALGSREVLLVGKDEEEGSAQFLLVSVAPLIHCCHRDPDPGMRGHKPHAVLLDP